MCSFICLRYYWHRMGSGWSAIGLCQRWQHCSDMGCLKHKWETAAFSSCCRITWASEPRQRGGLGPRGTLLGNSSRWCRRTHLANSWLATWKQSFRPIHKCEHGDCFHLLNSSPDGISNYFFSDYFVGRRSSRGNAALLESRRLCYCCSTCYQQYFSYCSTHHAQSVADWPRFGWSWETRHLCGVFTSFASKIINLLFCWVSSFILPSFCFSVTILISWRKPQAMVPR